eukprot:scaffold2128_cov38-Cyclotella_meneghiniana.AAC.3
MKAGMQSSRRSERETAQLKLADIYKTSVITDKTAEDVQKHRKEMAYPRGDFIAMIIAFCKEKGILKYCSAPFEADWQLVSLQKQGIIQQFYVIGTVLATMVPVMGWTPLKSLEQLVPFVVFMGIQLIEY